MCWSKDLGRYLALLQHNEVELNSLHWTAIDWIELNWNCNVWHQIRLPVSNVLNIFGLAAVTLQAPRPSYVNFAKNVSVPVWLEGNCISTICQFRSPFEFLRNRCVFEGQDWQSHHTHTLDSLEFNGSEMPPPAVCCVEGFGNDGPPIHQWSVARPSANQKAGWFVPTNESRRNPCSSYTSVVSGCFIRAHILNPQ